MFKYTEGDGDSFELDPETEMISVLSRVNDRQLFVNFPKEAVDALKKYLEGGTFQPKTTASDKLEVDGIEVDF